MKKHLQILLVLLFFSSCTERNSPDYPNTGSGGDSSNGTNTRVETPVAQFSYKIEQPLSVVLTNNSTNNPTKIVWDFGDGSTSTENSPTHKYAKTGSYIITLTVSNSAGSKSCRKTIEIAKPKVYVKGIKYIKVGKENMYYRTVCKDDDLFTTTWFSSTYSSLLNNASLPYQFIFYSPILMDGLSQDDYYTIYVYWNNKTNGDGTQILKQKMYTSSINKYPTQIVLTNDQNNTQVAILFSYK